MQRHLEEVSFKESLRAGAEIFHKLKEILKMDGHLVGVGDEGGFAPKLKNTKEALNYIMEAIKLAGYNAGKEIFIALDCAASEFYQDELYSVKYT